MSDEKSQQQTSTESTVAGAAKTGKAISNIAKGAAAGGAHGAAIEAGKSSAKWLIPLIAAVLLPLILVAMLPSIIFGSLRKNRMAEEESIMMTFYAAAGSYQIRNEDGKDMPYIMRLGKLQPVSIPEFSIWSMLLWDVLTHDELRKKYFEKMEEVKLDPSGFEKALEMLVKRKLIIKGVGYTGADALYNMLYDTYVIPLRGVQGTRRLLNIAKLLKQGKVNFFEAVYLLQPDMKP